MGKIIAFCATLMFCAALVSAQPYTVENFSFELPGDGKHTDWETVPGWSSDSVASDSGVESAWPGSTEGVYSGYIMGSDPAVWQLTGHTIAAGEEFLLLVDLQNNWSAATPELQLGLYYDNAGARVLAASTIVNPPTQGEGGWAEYSLNFSADDVPASIGNLIGIELDNVSTGGSWIGMDNVRLIPEPMTMSLLGIGGLSLVRRRKR